MSQYAFKFLRCFLVNTDIISSCRDTKFEKEVIRATKLSV